MPKREEEVGTARWPAYFVLGGFICIIVGILLRIVAHSYPALTRFSNEIGYLGLLLFIIGFFVQVSLE